MCVCVRSLLHTITTFQYSCDCNFIVSLIILLLTDGIKIKVQIHINIHKRMNNFVTLEYNIMMTCRALIGKRMARQKRIFPHFGFRAMRRMYWFYNDVFLFIF